MSGVSLRVLLIVRFPTDNPLTTLLPETIGNVKGRLEIGLLLTREEVVVFEEVAAGPGFGLLVFVAVTDTEYGVSGYRGVRVTLVPVGVSVPVLGGKIG